MSTNHDSNARRCCVRFNGPLPLRWCCNTRLKVLCLDTYAVLYPSSRSSHTECCCQDYGTAIFLCERWLAVLRSVDAAGCGSGNTVPWGALHLLATCYYRSGKPQRAYATLKASALAALMNIPSSAASTSAAASVDAAQIDPIRYLYAVCWYQPSTRLDRSIEDGRTTDRPSSCD